MRSSGRLIKNNIKANRSIYMQYLYRWTIILTMAVTLFIGINSCISPPVAWLDLEENQTVYDIVRLRAKLVPVPGTYLFVSATNSIRLTMYSRRWISLLRKQTLRTGLIGRHKIFRMAVVIFMLRLISVINR
jgi:hypothetical protein